VTRRRSNPSSRNCCRCWKTSWRKCTMCCTATKLNHGWHGLEMASTQPTSACCSCARLTPFRSTWRRSSWAASSSATSTKSRTRPTTCWTKKESLHSVRASRSTTPWTRSRMTWSCRPSWPNRSGRVANWCSSKWSTTAMVTRTMNPSGKAWVTFYIT